MGDQALDGFETPEARYAFIAQHLDDAALYGEAVRFVKGKGAG